MTVLVDTSILIDHLRGDERARDALRRVAAEGRTLAASVLTRVEILAGMRPAELEVTQRLFGVVEWVDVNQDIADRAGWFANRHLRSHPGVDPVDYVIAATALRLDAELWTRNIKHFPMFPALKSPY